MVLVAILGPLFRSESLAVAAQAQRLGVPFVAINPFESIGNYGSWVFQNSITNRAQAQAIVEYAMSVRKLRRFAILYPQHPYGEEYLQLFWDEVERRGGEIRGVESYPSGATTFSGPIKNLVARSSPDKRSDYAAAIRKCDSKKSDSYRYARCKDDALKSMKPLIDFDGLFIADYAGTIRLIAAALAAEDIIVETDEDRLRVIERTLGRKVDPVTLLGANGWNQRKITQSTGRTVENALFSAGFFDMAEDQDTACFRPRIPKSL